MTHALESIKYHFSTKWMSFSDISLGHPLKLNKIEYINFDWMCFPKIGLAHAPVIYQIDKLSVEGFIVLGQGKVLTYHYFSLVNDGQF